MVFACRSCNQKKADVSEEQFLASEWLARRRADTGWIDQAPTEPEQ